MYLIRLDQGDYLQSRGGFDWGRADYGECAVYETIDEARAAIARLRPPARGIDYYDFQSRPREAVRL
jgi:hypothetical protein